MQTLTQYEYLDRDMILAGVVDWIVKESPLIGVLPMKAIAGNSYKYNVELSLPTANWLTVGSQISESTGTYEQRQTDIYTMLVNSYTDKSQIALNTTQDPEAIDIALAAKAMAHEFEKTLIVGRTSVDSTTLQFKGLLRILAEMETATKTDLDSVNNDQVIANHLTATTLGMAGMDELVDAIKPGKPDMLLMSRKSRRRLNVLQRASGAGTGAGLVITDATLFGIKMEHYDGIPIYVSDWMLNNYPDCDGAGVLGISAYDFDAAYATGSLDSTVVLAMQIGEDKVTGLNAGEMKHERSDPEKPLPNYNAIENRFIWYCGAACFKKYSIAALIGVGEAAS